jgi:hypothetical protein
MDLSELLSAAKAIRDATRIAADRDTHAAACPAAIAAACLGTYVAADYVIYAAAYGTMHHAACDVQETYGLE